MNPYIVLGVTPEADDKTIRSAYLEGIREAPPERDPERFKALSTAYHRIKDEKSRHEYELFNRDSPGNSPLEVFLTFARCCAKPTPMPYETMKEYLRLCSKT